MSSNTGDSSPDKIPPNLPAHGVDTAGYHIPLDRETVRRIVVGIEDGTIPGFTPKANGVSGYAYSKAQGDLTVRVPSEAGLHMGLYVTAGSIWCHRHLPPDYELVLAYQVSEIVEAERLGVGIPSGMFKLKRVDLHFDIASAFPDITKDQIVSNARKRTAHFEATEDSGIQIGKVDIVFRMYDKILEARENGTTAYWHKIWGKSYDQVIRVEYQLRKRALKRLGITNINGFLSEYREIMDYLLDWVDFAEVQARHDQSRPRVGWWQTFRDLISSAQFDSMSIVDAPSHSRSDKVDLEPSLIGMEAKYIAAVGYDHDIAHENDGAVQELSQIMDYLYEKRKDRVIQKAIEKLKTYYQ